MPKSFRRGRWFIVASLLFLTIGVRRGSAQFAVCSDELNPFNIEFEIPVETGRGIQHKPPNAEDWILYWIPRKDLGCDANHKPALRNVMHFFPPENPSRPSETYYFSLACQNFVRSWLSRIFKVVRQNLIVAAKVHTIQLLKDNEILRTIGLQNKDIKTYSTEELLQKIEELTDIVNAGFSLPKGSPKINPEPFSELTLLMRTLRELDLKMGKVQWSTFAFNCVDSWFNCSTRLFKLLIGEEDRQRELDGETAGYAHIKKQLEDGVRIVRRTFGKADNSFTGIKLPMIDPCFGSPRD